MRYKKMSDKTRIMNLTELIKDGEKLGFSPNLMKTYKGQLQELKEER